MDARHHILDIMEDTIAEPAESLSGNAPRLETIELPKEKLVKLSVQRERISRKLKKKQDVL